MFKIIGVDGKEYGPVSFDQMKQWVTEGRINAQTRVQGPNGAEWKAAGQVAELGILFVALPPRVVPQPLPVPSPAQPQQNGLALASLVLGILSLVCFGFLAGIPAIICGHIARGRVRRSPAQFGGAGMALAGLILGYIGVVVTVLILPAMLLPALSKAKERAQRISCTNNMRQLGMAFRMWSMDNGDQFPFNVSTTNGGTLELCSRGADGFDRNSAVHFLVMSNELSTPKVLVCPQDTSKQVAFGWSQLQAVNVSYQVHSGTEVSETNTQQVLVICPVHGTAVLVDGSVQSKPRPGKLRLLQP